MGLLRDYETTVGLWGLWGLCRSMGPLWDYGTGTIVGVLGYGTIVGLWDRCGTLWDEATMG